MPSVWIKCLRGITLRVAPKSANAVTLSSLSVIGSFRDTVIGYREKKYHGDMEEIAKNAEESRAMSLALMEKAKAINRKAEGIPQHVPEINENWEDLLSEVNSIGDNAEGMLAIRRLDTQGTLAFQEAHPDIWRGIEKLSYNWSLIAKAFLNDGYDLKLWLNLHTELLTNTRVTPTTVTLYGEVTINDYPNAWNALLNYLQLKVLPILETERPLELPGERLIFLRDVKRYIASHGGKDEDN